MLGLRTFLEKEPETLTWLRSLTTGSLRLQPGLGLGNSMVEEQKTLPFDNDKNVLLMSALQKQIRVGNVPEAMLVPPISAE